VILKLGGLQCPGSTEYLASLEAVMGSMPPWQYCSLPYLAQKVAALRDDPIEP